MSPATRTGSLSPGSSRRFPDIDPVYARPIVDNTTVEPELPFDDVAFPAKVQSLVSQQTRTGRRSTAVLAHGQFFSDDVVDKNGVGDQRIFSRSTWMCCARTGPTGWRRASIPSMRSYSRAQASSRSRPTLVDTSDRDDK